jgi:phosphatidylserine/phosphatidylglycerophosphate/cardiolipin synthase-like enzyme
MVKKMLSLALLVFIIGCSSLEFTGDSVRDIIPTETSKEMEVYFCPGDDCASVLINLVNSSTKSVHCALFDVDLEGLIKVMGEKSRQIDVKLVVDNENYGAIKGEGVKKDTSSQYSHNKFCVIDGEIVTTGSFNPTFNGAYKNNNNLLIIYSKYLALNYESEFKELWNGNFGEGGKVEYPLVYLNGNKVENYFCPDDSCADKIIKELRGAQNSVYFMTFSFTDEEIADAMLFNSDIDIKGLFEKTGSGSQYSQFGRLKGFGVDVETDTNPYSMHHKVFIIDNSTVITGSMNPTASGNLKNDENILVIHDPEIASKYVDEFFRLF